MIRTLSLLLLLAISLPVEAGEQLRIAFGSCADDDKPNHPIWQAILNSDPDAFLMIGDNVYADISKPGSPLSARRMRAEYAKLAASAGFQQVRAHCPIYATWDDHDYGLSDGGAAWPFRDTAAEIFFEFFDPDSPARLTPGVYSAYMLSAGTRQVQIILLDTRYFRSELVSGNTTLSCPIRRYVGNSNSNATMLGAAQWQWLEAELAKPADVRLIVTSIQAIPDEHCWEKWANFPHERERLLTLVGSARVQPVVLLSGDRHLGDISRLPPNTLGNEVDLVEITASPLSASSGFGAGEPNQYRVSSDNVRVSHFGLIELTWGSEEASKKLDTSLRLIDSNGAALATYNY